MIIFQVPKTFKPD